MASILPLPLSLLEATRLLLIYQPGLRAGLTDEMVRAWPCNALFFLLCLGSTMTPRVGTGRKISHSERSPPSLHTPTGDQTWNPGTCPDWELNW